MSERKWTPGPWMYQYTRLGHTVRQPQHHHAIMVVNHAVEPEADARLIAAAPDLYEALEGARQTILDLINARNSEAEGSDEDWVGGIDAALAQARGEA